MAGCMGPLCAFGVCFGWGGDWCKRARRARPAGWGVGHRLARETPAERATVAFLITITRRAPRGEHLNLDDGFEQTSVHRPSHQSLHALPLKQTRHKASLQLALIHESIKNAKSEPVQHQACGFDVCLAVFKLAFCFISQKPIINELIHVT